MSVIDWTPDNDAKLVHMRGVKYSWPHIARVLGTLPSVAASRYRVLKRTIDVTTQRSRAAYTPYSAEEDEIIVRMKGYGSSYAQIAAHIPPRSPASIQGRWTLFLRPDAANAAQVSNGILKPWPADQRFDGPRQHRFAPSRVPPILVIPPPVLGRSECGNAAGMCAEERGAQA